MAAADPGPPHTVRWHPEAAAERDASWPPARVAIVHAAQKLESEGGRTSHPQVARAEARRHVNPTLETLMGLAGALDIEFTSDVRPVTREARPLTRRA